MVKLTVRDNQILSKIFKDNDLRYDVELKSGDFSGLSDEQINQIIILLSDVLCEFGLKPNDEPNETGLMIEDLIDKFNRFRAR